ncbi:hypothetical protein GCM10009840_02440 [Pseudolysinimonas kribbensis]|uniref:DUF2256 domain-containing protein n=1 Tax=Pseudolysinimonas kribbensis TaxID=433641 RepID=A0ABQ6K4R0_9MICO|nr:hypothetical protein GCM10025881_13570 [Pseudolysinimonas kribbensis]
MVALMAHPLTSVCGSKCGNVATWREPKRPTGGDARRLRSRAVCGKRLHPGARVSEARPERAPE